MYTLAISFPSLTSQCPWHRSRPCSMQAFIEPLPLDLTVNVRIHPPSWQLSCLFAYWTAARPLLMAAYKGPHTVHRRVFRVQSASTIRGPVASGCGSLGKSCRGTHSGRSSPRPPLISGPVLQESVSCCDSLTRRRVTIPQHHVHCPALLMA